jgi:nucleoside-diphosphate-sugar epimerase
VKVFVAGATGVLGRRLIARFRERGDEVVGLVRSDGGEALVRSLGGQPRQANLFDAVALARAADGCEAVIHAATAIPTKPKPRPEDWELNDRIRRDGTRALAGCAQRIGARRFLFQSVVWVARPADQSDFDETSPIAPHPVYQSAADGEKIAAESGLEASVLRCGAFFAADSAHTQRMAAMLRARKLPVVGKGDAVWAIVHADDAASAFVTAAHAERTGLWHVVDDVPVTTAALLDEFARLLVAPPPRRVPLWLARLLAGPAAVEFLNTSTRTSNRKFRAETGWQPRYPSFRETLAEVAAALLRKGG